MAGRRMLALVAAGAVLLVAGARAQITVEGGASILIFPRVAADDATDTLIQVVNGAQRVTYLRCRYLDASAAPSASFDLTLTGRQPTHWVVSHGRLVDPTDATCSQTETNCDGAGFDPGTMPAVSTPFQGALFCVQVDRSGAPLSGNALRGRATLTATASGDIEAYNALGLIGFDTNDGDDVLCLDGGGNPACATAEYSGCPREWRLTHLADGAPHPLAPADDKVWTSITALPCLPGLDGSVAASASLQIQTTSEFEQTLSTQALVPSFQPVRLGQVDPILTRDVAGTDFLQTRVVDVGAAATGFMLLEETERAPASDAPADGRTAANAHPVEAAAAILTFPYLIVDTANGTDTVVQISNTSDQPLGAFCVYENHTPICSGSGICIPDDSSCAGACQPSMAITTFRVQLTPRQPLGWLVGTGLTELPLDGVERIGPGGASNAGTNVPGVGASFYGLLRCVAVDDRGAPADRNALLGSASVETYRRADQPVVDATEYDAVGSAAVSGAVNGDPLLVLGGGEPEYAACPGDLVLAHPFDGATLGAGSRQDEAQTTLALVPCSADFLSEVAGRSTVQLLVNNEFEQRFSTSTQFQGQLVSPLSSIDSPIATRSIFHVGVAGTLTGQTYIDPVGGAGLVGAAVEVHQSGPDPSQRHSAALNVHHEGTHPDADLLVLPRRPCVGDCNGDGAVEMSELMLGVNINLGLRSLSACPAFDADQDAAVLVYELIEAVDAALDGCGVAPPTPTPRAIPTAVVAPTPASDGPEITYFGVASADDIGQQPTGVDADGRPVYVRPHGDGFALVIEARRGQNRQSVGASAFTPGGNALPDLQAIVSRPLGDGSAAVCDPAAPVLGGVPATQPFDFTGGGELVAAVNDLGCRVDDGRGQPAAKAGGVCTKSDHPGMYGPVDPRSEVQFCLPIAREWSFPSGDTIVAARVRSVSGVLGPVREIVVSIP